MGSVIKSLTNAELVERLNAEPQAFSELYVRFESLVLAYFLRRGARAEVAADLTAEVFASILVASRRFDASIGPAEAWIFAIARNVLRLSLRKGRVADRLRRRIGAERVEFSDASLDRVEELFDVDGLRERLAEALEQLPDDQRVAVLERVVDGREYEDLARELQCSPAVVRQRVSRGLGQLRAQLTGRNR